MVIHVHLLVCSTITAKISNMAVRGYHTGGDYTRIEFSTTKNKQKNVSLKGPNVSSGSQGVLCPVCLDECFVYAENPNDGNRVCKVATILFQ